MLKLLLERSGANHHTTDVLLEKLFLLISVISTASIAFPSIIPQNIPAMVYLPD